MNARIGGLLVTLAFGLFATIPALADPTLEVSGGILDGVDGVVVDGNTYDVGFVAGSCTSVFSPCNSIADFTFTTSQSDLDAVTALESVLTASSYSNDPNGILGYSPSSAPPADPLAGELYILIPYSLVTSQTYSDVISYSTNITLAQGVQFAGGVGYEITQDVSCDFCYNSVYSVWTPTSVPEPATFALFGAGLLGLGFICRRRAVKRAA